MSVCKDCLRDDDDWSLHKFQHRMGISYGPCECCEITGACVDSPSPHSFDHTHDLVQLAKIAAEKDGSP
jgi:hypothetical protein